MTIKDFIRIVEIRTKIVSLSTIFSGLSMVLWQKGSIPPLEFALLFLAAVAIDMGTTAFNSFYDYLSGVDSKQHNRELDKVLVHTKVPPGYALFIALGLFGFAGILGLILCFLVGWWLLPLGLVSMAIGFLYNGGPIPISRTPLGEVFAGGTLGSLLFLITLAVLGATVDLQSMVFSIPLSLAIAGILSVNNTCDQVGDKESGRQTLAIILGPRLAPLLVHGLIVAPVLGYLLLFFPIIISFPGVWLQITGFFVFTIGILLMIKPYITMFKRGFSHESKGPNMGAISKIFGIFSLLGIVSYLLFWLAGIPYGG